LGTEVEDEHTTQVSSNSYPMIDVICIKAKVAAILWGEVMLLLSLAIAPASGSAISLTPPASGTIRYFLEFNMLQPAPVGNMVQSTYFKTTDVNREFRRGFFEFAIPQIQGQIFNATLILTENRAHTTFPLPPDIHEITFYNADLVVNIEDYNRPTTFLASFETDANDLPQTFSFDITQVIIEFEGSNLGFRVKLAVDPMWNDDGFLGSGFSGGSAPGGAIIILTLADAMENLIDAVIELSLPTQMSHSILAKLKAAKGTLQDRNANNDAAALNVLQAFINQVQAQRGKMISEADADLLLAAAQEIIQKIE
jgi:hypothetical protein